MNKDKVIKKLHKILIKKATGFYYQEETLEYVADAKESKQPIKQQISMFNSDNELIDIKDNIILNDRIKNSEKNIKNKKSYQKSDTKDEKCENCGVEYSQNQISLNLKEEDVSSKTCDINSNENKQTLTLSKKKVTTHFVPPDMLAIKMLLEINSKELSPELFDLTDDELIKMIEELRSELGI